MLNSIKISLFIVPFRAMTNTNIIDMQTLTPFYSTTVRGAIITRFTTTSGIIKAPANAQFTNGNVNAVGIDDGANVRYYVIESRKYVTGEMVELNLSRAYSLIAGGVQISGLASVVDVKSLTRNQKLTLVEYPKPQTTKQTQFFDLGEKARVAVRINGSLIKDNYKFFVRELVYQFFKALAAGTFESINDMRIAMMGYKLGKFDGDSVTGNWTGQLSHRWNQVSGTEPIYYTLETLNGVTEAGYLEQQINKVIRSVGADQTEIFIDRFASVAEIGEYGANFNRAGGSWNFQPGNDAYSPNNARNMDAFDGPTLDTFPAESLTSNSIVAKYGQLTAPLDLSNVLLNNTSIASAKITVLRSRIMQADQSTLLQFKVGPTEVGRLTIPTQTITMPPSPLMSAIEEMDDDVHPFKTLMGIILNLIVAPLIGSNTNPGGQSIADAIKKTVKGFFSQDEKADDWGGISGNILVAATLSASELLDAPVGVRRMAIMAINSDVFGDFINAYRKGENLGSSSTISGIAAYQDRLAFTYGELSISQASQFESINDINGTPLSSPIPVNFSSSGGNGWGSFDTITTISVPNSNGDNASQTLLANVANIATKSIKGKWTSAVNNDSSNINGKIN